MSTVMDIVPREQQPTQAVTVGFTTLQGFELAQRAAKALSQSTLVPKEYQGNLPNCIVALNMAQRLNADPLMVMQNLVIVHGRPTWSAQFLIATANGCGRFSALRYEFKGAEGTDEWGCRAWAIEKDTGERLDGTWVTMGLARKEGWIEKNGSKWKTMPQQMLMYRAGSWWVRAYAPELSMGLTTAEEAADFIDVTPDKPHSLVDLAPAPETEAIDESTGEIVSVKAILAKIEAAKSKSEIGAIASSEEYAAAKAASSPEVWKAVQEAAAKRLEEVEKSTTSP